MNLAKWLSKCKGSLHKDKDKNQYKVIDGMQCRMEIAIR